MDKAVYNDWKDRNDVALLNNQNIISATLDFLQFYQTKFGFDFSKPKVSLRTLGRVRCLKKAATKTDLMYKKHNYHD